MTLNDLRIIAYKACTKQFVPPDETTFNPGGAIFRKWAELASAGQGIGPAVTAEEGVDEGGTGQAFATGAVLHWPDPNGSASLV